jgi:hypothetical protein
MKMLYFKRLNFLYLLSILFYINSIGQNNMSEKNIAFIEQVQSYQKDVKIKRGEAMFNDKIDMETFDIKYYLKIFDELTLKNKEYVFYYYYFDNFLDGKPYIYVKKRNFDLEKNINEFVNIFGVTGKNKESFIQSCFYHFLNDSINRAYNYVIPNPTERGFLQYLFFKEFGEQFALSWHANYKYKKVITTEKEIEEIVSKCREYELYKNNDTIENKTFEHNSLIDIDVLAATNPIPQILIINNLCEITWYEKTFYGIFKRTYQIKKNKQYDIKLKDEQKLVEIYPNITF